MRPRFRLKTKLVFAISGMVFVLVTALSYLYVSHLVRQQITEAYDDGDFVAHQVFNEARQAIEIDLSDTPIDANDPQAVHDAVQDSLQTDPGLNALLQSIVGYSPTIYDVAVTDAHGVAMMHTDSAAMGKPMQARPDFRTIRDGNFRKQLEIVYGQPRVYEVTLPLIRDGRPFGEVRVGISTVFLKSDLQPQLNNALLFSAIVILVSLGLAAGLSNLALRPLEAISLRLDQMTAGQIEAVPEGDSPRTDEYGQVATKINRLGRQMRDVQEVFSALKENLDQIMANLEDGLMLFTRDGRAVLVSASVESFIPKPRHELLGHYAEEIFADNSPLSRVMRTALELREPILQREIVSDGRRTQVTLDFIEERGERIGALLTLRDAESVHRIEDEIELSRRLAAIGRLTSGVAHEVKNPINAIVVHLEVLRQKLQQADPDTRRHMDVIGSEIQRLDRVVQTLVDFTRPVELRLSDVDLRRACDDVVILSSPEAERLGVRIEHEHADGALPARVDVDLFKQALLNIMLNGIQAMPNGGVLRLASRRENGAAVISVSDQGAGIPPEIRDKIFNLYFTTKKAGTGIGLAMTYRVMQLHNGSVDFQSQPGAGSTFSLRLPLLAPATNGAEQSEAAVRRS